jgi:hypothetical protein
VDPRFVVGIVLIFASVIGVVALVKSANASTIVYSARSTLTPGQHVRASDLAATSVRAGGVDKLYLQADDIPSGGVVVNRVVTAGELVPVAAVGSRAESKLTSVVVTVTTPLPQSVVAGTRVDVWAARQQEDGGFAAPRVIATSALVVRIATDKGVISSNSEPSVELLVKRSSTPSILEDIANGAAISVLPVDQPLGK